MSFPYQKYYQILINSKILNEDLLIFKNQQIYQFVNMQGSRTVHHQLIDEHKQFNRSSIEAVTNTISTVGREYHSVAIIGVQNSGKSTLLNFLFGTNFDVLKQQIGTRTTRGIWISLDKKQNILVFDVQGNDSMDRAQQQDYQKMVATYALVTANVLIINVWSKTIGQYNGTQYQTLKVIMEICITQFKQQSPKTILFCVRDFNDQYDNQGQTRRKIIKDVNDIWRKVQKPVQLQMYNQKPQKFFTIQVSTLRRYNSQKPQKFIEDIVKLRQKFVNSKNQGYVFAKQRTQYNLPISDLPQLTENAWNSIKTNKKLNLPNQKDQLASFRCSTIMNQIQTQFLQQLSDLNKRDLVTDLGKLNDKYMDKYQSQTYHYGKNITDQKSKQLQQAIADQLKKTAVQKLNKKSKELQNQFKQQSSNFSQQKGVGNLDSQMNKIFQVKVHDFLSYLKHLNIDVSDRKQRIDQLSNSIKSKMKQVKESFLKSSQNTFQNQSSRSIRLLTSQLIKSHFGPNFWLEAKNQIQNMSHQLIQNYRTTYKWATGDELDPLQYGSMEEKIRNQSKQQIKSELEKSFQGKILDQFKTKFNQDENGSQINFNLKTQQQISLHFDKTRQNLMQLIKNINQFNQAPRRSSIIQQVNEQNSLFESTWLSNITQQIDKQIISDFQKTIRRKKQGQMNQVPWWMFLLILYFVYDDIWFTQEDSPIIHYAIVVVLLVLATLLAIGQGKIIKQSVRMATDKLKQKVPFFR